MPEIAIFRGLRFSRTESEAFRGGGFYYLWWAARGDSQFTSKSSA